MNKSTTEGKFDQVKGKMKQAVGEAVGNERLANSGAADQVKGAAKEAWGNTKDAASTASDNARMRTEAEYNRSTSTAGSHTGSTAHDVREKITSTAQNVKNAVNEKAAEFKHEHKRSA